MGTRYQGPPDAVRALNAYIALMRASESVAARMARSLARHRLTVSQFGVLEALYHLGPLCQKALAGKILKSSGNISTVVRNLERRGLVTRRAGETDRRYRTVELTGEGRALLDRIFPGHVQAILREFSVLEPAEQDQLRRLCVRVGRQERGPGGSARREGAAAMAELESAAPSGMEETG